MTFTLRLNSFEPSHMRHRSAPWRHVFVRALHTGTFARLVPDLIAALATLDRNQHLVGARAGRLHYLRPFGDFTTKVRPKLLWRGTNRLEAGDIESLLHVRPLKCPHHLSIWFDCLQAAAPSAHPEACGERAPGAKGLTEP